MDHGTALWMHDKGRMHKSLPVAQKFASAILRPPQTKSRVVSLHAPFHSVAMASPALDDETLLFHQPANASITDPSTADASTVVFDRELPLEVRHSDDQDSSLGTLLTIKVKVLVLVSERVTEGTMQQHVDSGVQCAKS
jgi:hypothetical protein